MTESEWLSDEGGLTPLLRVLAGTDTDVPVGFRSSVRKELLFAIACSRSELVQDARLCKAIGVVERSADGLATEEESRKAREAVTEMASGPQKDLALAVLGLGESCYPGTVLWTAERLEMSHFPKDPLGNVNLPAHRKIWRRQAKRLRDIFGNPFRPVAINPAWLTATVTSLAAAAYQEHALPSGELDAARLAVLADALEEGGCDNADILNHLRGQSEHVRGCWAVDLLLGNDQPR